MESISAAQADRIIELLECLVDKSSVEDDLMTDEEAATRWKMSKDVVDRKCRNGDIIAFKKGRQWLIPRKENENANNEKTRPACKQ